MDAKSLFNERFAIRCAPPSGKRKVPIQFDAWIAMQLSLSFAASHPHCCVLDGSQLPIHLEACLGQTRRCRRTGLGRARFWLTGKISNPYPLNHHDDFWLCLFWRELCNKRSNEILKSNQLFAKCPGLHGKSYRGSQKASMLRPLLRRMEFHMLPRETGWNQVSFNQTQAEYLSLLVSTDDFLM